MTLFGNATTTSNNGNNSTTTVGDLKNDVELSNPPEDTISHMAFSRGSLPNDYLAVASWDKKVRIYEVASDGKSQGKHLYEHDGPVFSVDFSQDGSKVVSCGADKQAKMCDLSTQQTVQVAAHDQPIRCCRFFEVPNSSSPMVVTGSWDKTIKYWDLRSSTPAAKLDCQERVYAMDVKDNLLVVGTADRYINVVNLGDPTKVYKTLQSPLKWQTRALSCFIDSKGYAVGSIEGRCAIQYVEEKDSSLNFSFKCHRESLTATSYNVFSVNSISFHPVQGTFSTAGSDGSFNFWDKDAKHRLRSYPSVGSSITATAFNKTGSIFGYAVGYDWSKGYSGNSQSYPLKIMLHPVGADECKPRPRTTTRR